MCAGNPGTQKGTAQMHPNSESRLGKIRQFRHLRVGNQPAPAVVPGISAPRTRYIIDGTIVAGATPSSANADPAFDAQSFAQGGEGRMTVTLYPNPQPDDIAELEAAWGLHPILIEDLQRGGQRPKLERYDDVLFIVMRSAHYIDEAEDVDFSEFHVLLRRDEIAILCHDGRWIDGSVAGAHTGSGPDAFDRALSGLLSNEELLSMGPEAVLYRLLDAIVDGYVPVLRGIVIDKEQIERQVFSGDSSVAERIYRLSQEVIDLQHATSSLSEVVEDLSRGAIRYGVRKELGAYLQDVADHLTRVDSWVLELRETLAQILNVNGTLVAQRQNEDMKKISGWAAILFAPTLIGAIYGMNFDVMPELHWAFGYPLALGSMAALAIGLYVVFKKKKWM